MRGLRLGLGMTGSDGGAGTKPTLPFKMTVLTSRAAPGGSTNVTALTEFRLPLNPTQSNYNFTINWGDGSVDVITNSLATVPTIVSTAPAPGALTTVGTYVANALTTPFILHTYPASGSYQISILAKTQNGFPAIAFHDAVALTQAAVKQTDAFKISSLDAWGNGRWKSFLGAFQGVNFMTTAGLADIATAKHSAVAIWDRSFTYCKAMTVFPVADLSAATDITSMCNGCSALAVMPFVNTAKVIKANFAWVGCSALVSFPAIDLSKNVNFTSTWDACSGLTAFPAMSVVSATILQSCWRNCSSLVTFPQLLCPLVTNFVSTWLNTNALGAIPPIAAPVATSFSGTFQNSDNSAPAGPPPIADVQTATTLLNMFNGSDNCKADFSSWWPKLVTIMTNMFLGVDLNSPNSAANQTNYSALLKGWTGWTGGAGGSSSKSLQNNVVFNAGTSKYSLLDLDAVAARAYLVLAVGSGGRGWTITDGGGV